MTPQERLQFEDLKRRVRELEEVRNLNAYKTFVDRLIKKRGTVDTTNQTGTENSTNKIMLDNTITIAAGGGSQTITTLDAPDHFIELDYNGKIYHLGAWEK